ncbi:MAG: hypothetical protein KDJ25_03145 [Rhodoblastus sp.]|nr:hypothetical protein [Rhodoblastus sp.]
MTIDLPVLTPTRRAFLIAVAATTASSATPGAETSEAADLIVEIRQSFTLRGKPIPPEIFRDFGDGNLAESRSIWTSVDLDAAVGSNPYFDPIVRNGAWVAQGRAAKNGNDAEKTAYRYIGATNNGLLVAIATFNGGGSGIFTTLHILDLAPTRAFDDEGAVYTRLLLTNLRSVALGDRWVGEARIVGDEISVTTTRDGPMGGKRAPQTIKARRP